jgi:hypothetical protein
MNNNNTNKYLVFFGVVLLIGLVGYYALNAPDRRNSGEKVGDAINELSKGVDKATRQLQDRSPADKLNDAAKDAAKDLKKSTNPQ